MQGHNSTGVCGCLMSVGIGGGRHACPSAAPTALCLSLPFHSLLPSSPYLIPCAAAGAIKGIGQGVLGAFANPVSGMLDALSVTAEGVNATFGRNKDESLVGPTTGGSHRPPGIFCMAFSACCQSGKEVIIIFSACHLALRPCCNRALCAPGTKSSAICTIWLASKDHA